MKDRWVTWYQDYQEGRRFRGRALFGVAARLAELGYRLGYRIRRQGISRKKQKALRPRARVLGVGNLTVGGSGKTSLVDYLASRLLRSGRSVSILTRGYGRLGNNRVVIRSDQAEQYDAEQVGDEPLMLARRNPTAAVIVDADRASAARDFEQQDKTDIFLLDDSLQYHGIRYDCRIMTLLDGELRPPYRLFPAGRWREPPSEAIRADAVAVIVERPDCDLKCDTEKLRFFGFTGPIFPFSYEFVSWRLFDGRPAGFLSLPEGCRVGVFCALARPERFLNWLSARGIAVGNVRRFPDHYRYRQDDINQLSQQARDAALDFLVTTEKDAVKLTRFVAGDVRIIYPEVRLAPCGDAGDFERFVERVFAHG